MIDSTAAARQRRYRAHKRGDHSLCDPERADCVTVTVTPSVTRDAVTSAVPELGTRGRRLWRQVTDEGTELMPGERVLLEEACRTADRLDTLDRILRGDEDAWMRFRVNQDGDEVTVVVNNVLSEVRQQQVTLKQLLAELRQSRAAGAGKPGKPRQPAAPSQSGGAGVAGVADLTTRIAERLAQAQG
jgi:hypothetical protein